MAKPKRLRILLWHWGRRGGGPRYTLELARALLSENEVDVCLSVSRQSEIYKDFVKLPVSRWDVDTYSGLTGAIVSIPRLLFLRRRFWQYVTSEYIDLIVCTMSHLWNVPVLFGHSTRPPYMMILHDAAPHPGEDVLLRHWLLKSEVAYAEGVITLTEHVRNRLCIEYPYPKERTWVIPHGVFPYTSAVPPSMEKPVRLLFFGRILPYKGLDLLLEAHGILRARGVDVHLHIAGPGNLAPFSDQLALLDNVSIDNRWIPEEDIADIFRSADVSVLPYREASQSGVIATSYAAGLPVVVTPIGGLVEQVRDEVTGLICKSSAPEDIALAIERIAVDNSLRLRCAEGARHAAEHELSWTVIARRFVQAGHELLALQGAV